MTKSLIIDLGLGNLEQDTPVRIKLWWNSEQKRADEYNTNLPPDTILSRLYKIWQKLYNIRYQTVSSRSSVTLLAKKPIPTYIRRCPQWNFDDLWQNIDNLSNDLNDNNLLQQLDDFISLDAGLLDLCENISSSDINKNLGLAQQKLEERFNIWLQYREFINCQHQWDKNEFLNINDEIFVIFQIQDHLIRKLPWNQWNFFDKYPLATHAFGSLSYQGRVVSSKSSNQVEILAVLCDDEGIDLQQERIIFDQLVNDLDAKIDFMPFPFNRKQLEERLEKGCDILFFAGHSKTQSESGHIYINDQESVTINDLKNSFEAAIDHGLRLAIFNSCDGLGLANDLAKLNISHVIVMKEQVSNFIAQEFFSYFLEFFAQEKYPIFLAVQEARNKLKKHELQHPGASFLPALCINPAVVEPLTWENLRAVNTKGFHADWGNVPPVNHFFGRTEELEKLKQWIVNESCRVLAIVGSGGIGKTGLSVKLGQGGIGKTDLSVQFSPEGKLFAGGDINEQIRIWRMEDNQLITICDGHNDYVLSISFSPDSKLIASSSIDKTVKIWEVNTGKLLKTLKGHTGWVITVKFSPDGKTIASCGGDGIKIWNIENGECLKTLPEQETGVFSIDFSPDGKKLVSGSPDTTIKMWDVETGKLLQSLPGLTKLTSSVSFSPNGKLLANSNGGVTYKDKEEVVKIWEFKDGKWQHIQTLTENKASVRSISFSPDSQKLVCCVSLYDDSQKYHPIKIYDVNTYEFKTLEGHISLILSTAFHADNQRLVSSSEDETIKIWDINTGKCLKTLYGYTDWQLAIALHPNGEILASGDNNATVRLWNIKTGKCLKTLLGHKNTIWSLAFSHDGNQLASGSTDTTIKIWDIKTGKCLKTFFGEEERIWSLAFSPNDKKLASSSFNQTINIWDIETGKYQNLKPDKSSNAGIKSVAYSPNGQILISGSEDSTICIWDANTYECLQVLIEHTDRVNSVKFINDQIFVSASEDSTIRLWNLNTYECLKVFRGHQDRLTSVDFNGQILVSGSTDRTVRLWDIKTGECRKILSGHTKRIDTVVFSADGQTVASCSRDGTISLWDMETYNRQILRVPRPYEGMNITGIKGLTEQQKVTLKTLGAVEDY